jgi:uncharacterized protein YcgI (DUF1989 family)
MQRLFERVMPPKTGLAVVVKAGQHLRVTDLEGKQVVDMAVFNEANVREKLSTSYSRARQKPKTPGQYLSLDALTEGHVLMSTIARPMLTIVRDTPEPKGVHDVHNRMCNRLLFESHGYGTQDGCLEILSQALAPWGIAAEDLPDTMDLFMNFRHDLGRGGWVIEEPVSKPGDYVEFRAEMDCVVGLSNCPLDVIAPCNAYHCTPVKAEIFA